MKSQPQQIQPPQEKKLKNILTSQLFPKICDVLSKVSTKYPPLILNIESFMFNKSSNKKKLDLKDTDLLDKLLKYSFQPENEYINKFFYNYNDNEYLKLILLSNLYKILIIQQINLSLKFTSYDFLCSISLICSDFPKKIIETINEFYMITKNERISFSEEINSEGNAYKIMRMNIIDNNWVLSNEINLGEFFIFFSSCFIYYDFLVKLRVVFLKEINDKIFENNTSNGLSYTYIEINILSIFTHQYFISDVNPILESNEDLKQRFLEAICLTNNDIVNELDKKMVNTVEEIFDLLSKKTITINFKQFIICFAYNHKLIESILLTDSFSTLLETKLKSINILDNLI